MVGGHGICGAVLLFAAFALLLIATSKFSLYRFCPSSHLLSGVIPAFASPTHASLLSPPPPLTENARSLSSNPSASSFLFLKPHILILIKKIVSSPVFRQISFLNIYSGGQTATFGTFGYCVDTSCTPRQLGYDITALTGAITNNTYVNENIVRLTKAFILHPIAAGKLPFVFPYLPPPLLTEQENEF